MRLFSAKAIGILQVKRTYSVFLNEDIISEIMKHLAIWDNIELLQSSPMYYFSPTLWNILLWQKKSFGLLACSPSLDVFSLPFEAKRRVGRQTAFLAHNLSRRVPKRTNTYRIPLVESDKPFSLIPGTGILITSAHVDGRLSLKCWDLRGDPKELESTRVFLDDAGQAAQSFIPSPPCFVSETRCLQGFVLLCGSEARLIVLLIEYDDVIKLEVSLDLPLLWDGKLPPVQVQVTPSAVVLLGLQSVPVKPPVIVYACIDLDAAPKSVLLHKIALTGSRDSTGYFLRGFFLDKHSLIHIFLSSVFDFGLISCTFPCTMPTPASVSVDGVSFPPGPLEELTFFTVHCIPDTTNGLFLFAHASDPPGRRYVIRFKMELSPQSGHLARLTSATDQLLLCAPAAAQAAVIESCCSNNILANGSYNFIFQDPQAQLELCSYTRETFLSSGSWSRHSFRSEFKDEVQPYHFDPALGILIGWSSSTQSVYKIMFS